MKIRTIKQAMEALKEGKTVTYTLDWCFGRAGSVPQSIVFYPNWQNTIVSIKNEIECLKRDNKPFKNAGFKIINN